MLEEKTLTLDNRRNVYIPNVSLEELKKTSLIENGSEKEIVIESDNFRIATLRFERYNLLTRRIYVKNMEDELILEKSKFIDEKDPEFDKFQAYINTLKKIRGKRKC